MDVIGVGLRRLQGGGEVFRVGGGVFGLESRLRDAGGQELRVLFRVSFQSGVCWGGQGIFRRRFGGIREVDGDFISCCVYWLCI